MLELATYLENLPTKVENLNIGVSRVAETSEIAHGLYPDYHSRWRYLIPS